MKKVSTFPDRAMPVLAVTQRLKKAKKRLPVLSAFQIADGIQRGDQPKHRGEGGKEKTQLIHPQ
jgi:hypothetical protein